MSTPVPNQPNHPTPSSQLAMIARIGAALLMVLSALVFAPGPASADTNIVGGEDAVAGDHPFIAEIERNGNHQCGGSLLNPQWVITAAHCLYESYDGRVRVPLDELTIVLGEYDRSTDEGTEQTFDIQQVVIHPDYTPRWDRAVTINDLAMIELSGKAELGDNVSVVSIAPYVDEEELTLAGWGDTISGDGVNIPDILQVADFDGGDDCLRYTDMICHRNPESTGCSGDSGGPWYRTDGDGDATLIMVHNGGTRGCPLGGLTIGTELHQFIDWIQYTMAEDRAIFSINAPVGWTTRVSGNDQLFLGRGWVGQVPLAGDMNGDGRDELVVHNFRSGGWYARETQTGAFLGYHSSGKGNTPLSGDLDGDGTDEFISFKNGYWNAAELNGEVTAANVHWGTRDDRPLVGDVDGDGTDELIVWRPSNGKWYAMSADGTRFPTLHWGVTGDQPLIGDLDGDGDDDYMIWRPSNGTWYGRDNDGSYPLPEFRSHGGSHDVARLGDMNGDGKDDLVIWRPSTGEWYPMDSQDGSLIDGWGTRFGEVGDWPVIGQFG